jgi:hypothetical protein
MKTKLRTLRSRKEKITERCSLGKINRVRLVCTVAHLIKMTRIIGTVAHLIKMTIMGVSSMAVRIQITTKICTTIDLALKRLICSR